MPETRHDRLVFVGERLYEVVASTDDGQTATLVVAADDEWKARTRFMAAQTDLDLHGQSVRYVVTEVV